MTACLYYLRLRELPRLLKYYCSGECRNRQRLEPLDGGRWKTKRFYCRLILGVHVWAVFVAGWTRMDPDVDMDDRREFDVLMPGLPDDLALQCLARIPRVHFDICARVSRSWRKLILDKYTEVVEMRRSIGIFEDWPFVLLQGPRDFGSVWRALDPVTLRWMTLPTFDAKEAFHAADKECFVAGRNLLVVGIDSKVEVSDALILSG